ncbi:MAG: sugar ABC transporter permease [Euzebyaceae bacterium]|jgi:alpha-glucoside transport system permease protein|nr:sugar ABC transporter permease [Euzebyaceae bacterium]
MLKVINGIIAVVAGVGGALVLYWGLNALVERLPERSEERIKPYVFIGPALVMVTIFLVYPAVRTIYLAFFDASSENFVGFTNFVELARDRDIRVMIVNTLLWIIFVPAISVSIGLAVAVLADKLRARGEKLTKSIIFLPMAISFVGASTIWRFVYDASKPAGTEQIGLLNGIWTAFGNDPVGWLQVRTGSFNDFLLMIIMVWLQAGFAMVLLSAAIKNVPDETIEAARIDGATERQIFWRVTVPQIWATLTVVFTTIVIGVLKAFDIVYVMTGGNFETDVIANRFFTELFSFRQNGRAAAIVVVLIIAVIPVMILNIRRFRAEEAR